jgi:hypothetical protein
MRAIIGFTSRRASESEAVRQHAENDRGVAATGRLANQDGKKRSARKPSSEEVSVARQSGAGKTSTAAPQNGQNEPHDGAPRRLGRDVFSSEECIPDGSGR